MKKNYLVVETSALDNDGKQHDFIHFINLKEDLQKDVESFIYHLYTFFGKKGQWVTKVYFSEDRLTNW